MTQPTDREESLQRLEEQVERLKQKQAQQKQSATPPQHKPIEPDSEVESEFARMAKSLIESAERNGIRIVTEEEAQAIHQKNSESARLAYWSEIVPAVYSEPFDFAKSKGNPVEIRKAIAWKYGPRGLYIIGETGSSKSRVVANALKPYFMAGGTVRYLSGVEFSEQCTAITLEGKGLKKWKHDLCNVGVLWIDDLGKRWTKATEEECFSIVEDRTSRGRPIIVTTNYGREEMLAKQHDPQIMEPLLRRFRDYMDALDFDK